MSRLLGCKSVVYSLVALCACTAAAQTQIGTQAVSDPQAITLANAAYLALSRGTVVNDVVLTGTATWVAGGTHDSGSATVKVKGASQGRLDLNLSSNPQSEIHTLKAGIPVAAWVGGDHVAHAVAFHNALLPAGWASPVAVLAAATSAGATLTYVGRETRSGISVDHIHAVPASATVKTKDSTTAALVQRLTAFELYLDATSHLLWFLGFNMHPENDAGLNIPAEVKFADYRTVSGIAVPFRVQRLIQGRLNLDLTVTAAAVNSGVADSDFSLQ